MFIFNYFVAGAAGAEAAFTFSLIETATFEPSAN